MNPSVPELALADVQRLHERLEGGESDSIVVDDLAEEIARRDGTPVTPHRLGGLRRALQAAAPAPVHVIASRLQACAGCPEIRVHRPLANLPPVLQCQRCGCIMNLKARMSSAECPARVW